LGRIFPGVRLQGKGLLATEAFVSLPLAGEEGAALAVTSHVFEFLTDAGEPLLAHQLARGETYSVVVTTGGGFYRYQLHDLVEVVGFVAQAPLLRFAGKTDLVSDRFGEKLNERFVAGVLDRLFARHRLLPRFAMLAPDLALPSGAPGYVLYLETEGSPDLAALARELDQALGESFHYAYCRRLGQLAPARIASVVDGAERYLIACRNLGQKLGDVKPTRLHKAAGWSEWLGEQASGDSGAAASRAG
ncbi:MAG TPA: GH3 auxin-responsive promoter family protein, partial [Thermoanaerobaculia bacterium]|nr:GH3 auxin-responsive promoter family protein [Thermoanaerobaculia bacterium]